MLVFHNHFSFRIDKTERQAAKLRTLSPIRAAPETGLANVALTAIAYAKRPMYKYFQRNFGTSFVYLPYFTNRQFPCQNNLTEARFPEELHPFRCSIVHLRTGMKRYRRKIQFRDSHILHNQSIHANPIQGVDHLFRLFQFFFFQNRIDRDINTCIIQVSMFYQRFDIFQRIHSRCTGAKFRCTDIYGICSVIDSFDTTFQILRRGEKFYFTLLDHSISLML